MMQMKNWMVCPPCHDSQHSVHVDGNSKLKRFQRAGRQENVYHICDRMLYWASQKKVITLKVRNTFRITYLKGMNQLVL